MEAMRKSTTIMKVGSRLIEEKRQTNVPKIVCQTCISRLSIFQKSVPSKRMQIVTTFCVIRKESNK